MKDPDLRNIYHSNGERSRIDESNSYGTLLLLVDNNSVHLTSRFLNRYDIISSDVDCITPKYL